MMSRGYIQGFSGKIKRRWNNLAYKRTLSAPTPLSDLDYSRNAGTVEGVWMFIRHGDRTPGRSLSAKKWRDEEASYWITKLPTPNTASVYSQMSSFFPVKHDGLQKSEFIDVARNPFGFLTSKGLSQLKENGQRFSQRYEMLGYHNTEGQRASKDFLAAWDTRVYTTNYLRTVLSVQSFLSGLLGVDTCITDGDERSHDAAVTKECIAIQESMLSDNDKLVPVIVRELDRDPLNAFDRNPELVAALSTEVMTSEEFIQGDGCAAPLAARLANILPGLVKPRTGGDYALQSPSGINWVEAADHFVCRNSHGLPLSRFSEHDENDHIEQTLQALAHPTMAHLSWRFRQWYGHDKLLAEIAAPPLREVVDQMVKSRSLSTTSHEKRPFVVYSCHDITILGLLYGIGAQFLEKEDNTVADDNTGIGIARYWPPYGSHLTFELVRVDSPKTPSSHVVRILLNGEPVKSLKLGREDAQELDGVMTTNDLHAIVSRLETSGAVL